MPNMSRNDVKKKKSNNILYGCIINEKYQLEHWYHTSKNVQAKHTWFVAGRPSNQVFLLAFFLV